MFILKLFIICFYYLLIDTFRFYKLYLVLTCFCIHRSFLRLHICNILSLSLVVSLGANCPKLGTVNIWSAHSEESGSEKNNGSRKPKSFGSDWLLGLYPAWGPCLKDVRFPYTATRAVVIWCRFFYYGNTVLYLYFLIRPRPHHLSFRLFTKTK